MSACNRCIGHRVVPGAWGMETCPECGGTGSFEPRKDKNVPGCLAVTIVMAALVLASLAWPVIGFFAEVLG